MVEGLRKEVTIIGGRGTEGEREKNQPPKKSKLYLYNRLNNSSSSSPKS